MSIGRMAVLGLALVVAVAGIGAAIGQALDRGDPQAVDRIDLRKDDAADAELVADESDDDDGDGDRTRGDDGTAGGANTGDGDRTRGNDGTSGGANTGDGDRTRGNDGTSGGANSGDGDRTRGNDGTSGGANTGDGDRTVGNDGTAGGDNSVAAAGFAPAPYAGGDSGGGTSG